MIFKKLLILLFPVIFSSCFSLSIDKAVEVDENQDWLFIGGDAAKTNISKSKADLVPPFNLYWEYDVDGGLAKNCLSVSDAILFANTLNGEFYALDILSGKSLGRISTIGKASYSTPLIAGNDIIISSSGDNKSKLFSYNLFSGVTKWKREIGWVESSPIRVGDDCITSSVNGLIYRVNIKTGSIVWTNRPSDKKKYYGSFYTSPTVTGNLVIAGNADHNMYAFDLATGKEVWSFAAGSSIPCDASASDGKIYFGSDDLYFYCLDTLGKLVWERNMGSKFLSSSTFYKDNVIISAINGSVYALDKNTGDTKWTFATRGAITASPLLQDNKIFIGSYDRYFYCLDAFDGRELWKYQCEGRIKTSAVVWKEFIFTASDEKYVYCFSNVEHPKQSSGK